MKNSPLKWTLMRNIQQSPIFPLTMRQRCRAFFIVVLNRVLNKQSGYFWFRDVSVRMRRHSDVHSSVHLYTHNLAVYTYSKCDNTCLRKQQRAKPEMPFMWQKGAPSIPGICWPWHNPTWVLKRTPMNRVSSSFPSWRGKTCRFYWLPH